MKVIKKFLENQARACLNARTERTNRRAPKREDNVTEQAVGQHATIQGFREWMAVILMLSGGVMLGLVVAAMSPVAHEMSTYFGSRSKADADLVAQMIVTAPSIGIILGGPFSGWLMGFAGAKRFFLGALAIFGLAGSAGLYLEDASTLLVTRFSLGLATSGIVTAMIVLISEHYTPELRARVLGFQSATGAFFGVMTIEAAGRLGEFGWRMPFALYLLAFLVLALGIFFLPSSPRRARRQGPKAPTDLKPLIALWPIYLMIIPMFVAVYMPNIQVSFLLRDDGIVAPLDQSHVIETGAFTVAVAALCFGALRKRFSGTQILIACFVFQGIGIALMGASHTAVPIALGCGVLGIGTGIANPLISDLIVARTTPEVRGAAIGISYTARYSGDFINPFVMLPLATLTGLHNAFLVVGGAFLLGVVIAILWRQSLGKTAAA
jgi:MFS family permease